MRKDSNEKVHLSFLHDCLAPDAVAALAAPKETGGSQRAGHAEEPAIELGHVVHGRTAAGSGRENADSSLTQVAIQQSAIDVEVSDTERIYEDELNVTEDDLRKAKEFAETIDLETTKKVGTS